MTDLFQMFPAVYGWIAAGASLALLLAGTGLGLLLLARARREQRRGAALVENLSEGIYRSSLDGRMLRANPALVRLNGYETEAELLAAVRDIGAEWYVQPNRRQLFGDILHRDGKVENFISEIYRHRSRERIWISENARLVHHPRSRLPLFYEGSVREVTATVNRLRLEEQFQKLTAEFPGALFHFTAGASDDDITVHYLSRGIEALTGYAHEEHLADPGIFRRGILAADRERFSTSLNNCTRTLELWEHEFRFRTQAGEERWLRIVARPERQEQSTSWFGYVIDVSARKRQEMEIRELAFYDPLTRLPNRRLFLDRMAALTGSDDARRFGAVLFVDLDNFKTLNDTQGHDAGDEFLVEVARRLKACVEPQDLVARLGGDEFVVLLERTGGDAGPVSLCAITVANRILASLREEYRLGDLAYRASASVGVVVFDGSERRVDEILKRADLAMYQAKAAGRNSMAMFDPSSILREEERYRLAADLRTAMSRGEITLHFQPQMDDAGQLVGAEALLRWVHPVHGEILPARFVPVAEQFGMTVDLAAYVLEHGLRTLAAWRDDPRTRELRLAVNVSVSCFAGDQFVPMLMRLLERQPVDLSLLTLELTENVMAKDFAGIGKRMHDLKALGIRLSLDDFGTGYSSLSYLKRLPLDEVKIDGGFVRDIERGDSDQALVRTILAMARTLGLVVVAEHVENVRQEAFLRAFGCDYFQGYLYGPAMPEAEFMAFVQRHRPPVSPELAMLAQPA